MNVLIIEDEKYAAERLKQLLKETGEEFTVAGTLETIEESIKWLMTNPHPDILFMDIQLGDGICFEIFKAVQIDIPVIFITAYDEYAIRAFKVNSIDYLLKPVDLSALNSALEKYRMLQKSKNVSSEKISKLVEQLVQSYKTRFFVRAGPHFKSILATEIACFFIVERCTFLRTMTGKDYDLDFSLEQIEKQVDPAIFYRINRSFIVNIDAITDLINYSAKQLKIKLKNIEPDADLFVSRDRTSDFKKWLGK